MLGGQFIGSSLLSGHSEEFPELPQIYWKISFNSNAFQAISTIQMSSIICSVSVKNVTSTVYLPIVTISISI